MKIGKFRISKTTITGVLGMFAVAVQIYKNPTVAADPHIIGEAVVSAGLIFAGDEVPESVTVTDSQNESLEDVVE